MCLEKLWLVGDELGATKVEGEGFILIKLLFLEKKHGAGLLLSPYRWREVFCDYHYGEVSFRPCCLLMHHCCMTAIVPGHWKWFSAYHDHPPPISAWRHHHHIIIIITLTPGLISCLTGGEWSLLREVTRRAFKTSGDGHSFEGLLLVVGTRKTRPVA